jgi:hypothetical protein
LFWVACFCLQEVSYGKKNKKEKGSQAFYCCCEESFAKGGRPGAGW